MTHYIIQPECSLRRLGDTFMVMVYPEAGKAFQMHVNESFWILLKKVREMESFTADDLCNILKEEYSLDNETAGKETAGILSLWEQCGLTATLPDGK